MFLAVIAMCFGGAVGAANSLSPYLAKDYKHVNVGKTLVIDSSKASMETLRKGIAVQGEGYAKSTLTIDLTKYTGHNKAKQVRLNDGQTRTTYCPVETIPMTVTDAKVMVKIPYGCSWGFNVSSGMMSTWNSIDAQGACWPPVCAAKAIEATAGTFRPAARASKSPVPTPTATASARGTA